MTPTEDLELERCAARMIEWGMRFLSLALRHLARGDLLRFAYCVRWCARAFRWAVWWGRQAERARSAA